MITPEIRPLTVGRLGEFSTPYYSETNHGIDHRVAAGQLDFPFVFGRIKTYP